MTNWPINVVMSINLNSAKSPIETRRNRISLPRIGLKPAYRNSPLKPRSCMLE